MRRILLYFVLIVSLLGPADIVFAENSYVWAGLGDGNSLTRIDPNLYGNDLNNWDANDPSPGEVGPWEYTVEQEGKRRRFFTAL